jgi:hypothetical protein
LQTLAQLKSGQLIGIQRLSLSENLDSFPEEILSLAESLEVLDLSNNNLSSLPSSVASLHKLKIIFLSNNPFKHLPEVLGLCPNLNMIGMKSCQISDVPARSLPPKLRWLTLTNNDIESLPESLGDCTLLQKLMLAGNRLSALPHSLVKLKNLQLLRISANNLNAFPEQLLALPKLAWLAFSGNPFCQTTHNTQSIPRIASSEFILGEQLGEGASGIIHEAQWTTKQTLFPNDIAVKVFKGGVTSDGYPEDELISCIKAGQHPNLVQTLAHVDEDKYAALVMKLIPKGYSNLGLPPSFESCTRDLFPTGFYLPRQHIEKIVTQMESVFHHLHDLKLMHGDLYAHNTLIDINGTILFGDFGAASMYHMLTEDQQVAIKQIEQRALDSFIEDMYRICH